VRRDEMAKTYEQKMKEWKALHGNHAAMETNMVKFYMAGESENAALQAGIYAHRAARWIFTAYPELRESN
jgi:hypothetical protein